MATAKSFMIDEKCAVAQLRQLVQRHRSLTPGGRLHTDARGDFGNTDAATRKSAMAPGLLLPMDEGAKSRRGLKLRLSSTRRQVHARTKIKSDM